MAGMALAQFYYSSSSSKDKKEPEKQPDINHKYSVMRPMRFVSGVSCKPHDEKVHKGGEDAWTASERLIAVADGVGGWADRGVDSGIFSR